MFTTKKLKALPSSSSSHGRIKLHKPLVVNTAAGRTKVNSIVRLKICKDSSGSYFSMVMPTPQVAAHRPSSSSVVRAKLADLTNAKPDKIQKKPQNISRYREAKSHSSSISSNSSCESNCENTLATALVHVEMKEEEEEEEEHSMIVEEEEEEDEEEDEDAISSSDDEESAEDKLRRAAQAIVDDQKIRRVAGTGKVINTERLRAKVKAPTTKRIRAKKSCICTIDACGARFASETNLRRHKQAVHVGLKPFHCIWTTECTFRGKARYDVIRHVRTVHMRLPPSKREAAALALEEPDVAPEDFVAEDTDMSRQMAAQLKSLS